MKDKEHLIYFDVYGYKITLVKTKDIIKSRNKRSKRIGSIYKEESNDDCVDGLHCHNEKLPDSFIFLHSNPSINSLSHECYHAISRLFEWIDAEHEEELFAYHLGYLIEQAYKFYYGKS